MKKRLTLLLILLLTLIYLQAQEFEFPLYFEDAFGEKDTIFLGYDMNATTGIDENFGEVNIKDNPLMGLDVRIVDYNYGELWCDLEENIDYSTFHTKKQITDGNCDTPNPIALGIIIAKDRFPIKVRWNKNIFPSTCGDGPIITDWHPGGWFDAPCDNTQEPVFMSTIDSVIFETTSIGVVTTENDTVNYLFYNWANLFSPVDDIYQTTGIKIFPNPVNDKLTVSLKQGENVLFEEVNMEVQDIFGRIVIKKEKTSLPIEIDVSSLQQGIYFIHIEDRYILKFIKTQ